MFFMQQVLISKQVFSKILSDVETLIDDVELALDTKIQQRINDIETGKEKGKSEKEYYDYLSKRGIKLGSLRH